MPLQHLRITHKFCEKVAHFDVERAEEIADMTHEQNLEQGSDMVYVYPCEIPLRDYEPPPHFHIGRKRGEYGAALGTQGREAQAKATSTWEKRLEYYQRRYQARKEAQGG